jgi:indole-3-glycerol phosphate synthase
MGADAVLLIAAVLSDDALAEAQAAAAACGIEALVEVHDADEARRVTAIGASLVGVNNRNLRSFTVDLATAESLRSLLPERCVAVAESGVATPAAAARMAAAGYDAVLVGEAAVRHPDPAGFVASLRGRS